MANQPSELFGGPLLMILRGIGTGHIAVQCQGIDDVSTCTMRVWLESDPSTVCESPLKAGIGAGNYYANEFSGCSLAWPDPTGILGYIPVEHIIEIDGGNGNKVSKPLDVAVLGTGVGTDPPFTNLFG